MNKVFLDLSPEEMALVESMLGEIEQTCWSLERTEEHSQLCGYFEADFQKAWELLQRQIPVLKSKQLLHTIIEECDWKNEYKKYLKAFQIGPLHIVPCWEREQHEIPEGQFGIYLDAEMAFGTGAHETTQLCLARIIEYRNLFPNGLFLKKVIDVGCGSGILSIAAAKVGFNNVYGFDIDPDVVQISKKNAIENQVPFIEFRLAGIKDGILGHQADLVTANVLAPTLIENASILVNTIKKYGCLCLSGILNTEVGDVKNEFDPLVTRYWDSFVSNVRTSGQWSEIAYIRT